MKNLKLKDLSVRQKLGMLYCARPHTEADLKFTLQLIREHSLGCVQLAPQKKEFIRKVREAADYPILIICDTETGFPTSDKQRIPLIALAACNKPEYYEVFAKAIATEARAAGFNGTWGPVIDVLKGNGPCKVHRHFSDDPLKVAQAAEIICKVYARNGYMSCGKHFPGGKDKPFDSHMAPLPSDFSREDLINQSMLPYRYLMERDLLPSIMTSHTTLKNVDPENPASVSAKVQKLIRDTGWDGVSFTDSFAMMAILQQYGEENVLGLAVAAGNDIILPNYRTPTQVSFGHLVKNYQDGMFTEERLNEAARRVLALQERLSRIPEAVDVFTEEDQALYDSIAKNCITAVVDDGTDVALNRQKSKLFIIMTENARAVNEAAMEITTEHWYSPQRIADKILEVYPNAGIEFFPEFSEQKDNERVLLASAKYDETVFVTFCETKAFLGTDCLTRRAESVINSATLSGKLAAVVHFGNPFALQPLLHVPRKVFGYLMPDSQVYAIDVLAGKLPANGTLPFQIQFP